MTMSRFKERLFLRVPAFHKYLTNICYVQIFGPHPTIIVPGLAFRDFIEVGNLHYIIRTAFEPFGNRRYPLYHVLHNKLYTRTLKEIVNGVDIKTLVDKGKLKKVGKKEVAVSDEKQVSDTVGKGGLVGGIAEGSLLLDEDYWDPITVSGILKKESYSELFHPSSLSLIEQLKLMAIGWASIEFLKWFLGQLFTFMAVAVG